MRLSDVGGEKPRPAGINISATCKQVQQRYNR
jgi:hypothetical protein